MENQSNTLEAVPGHKAIEFAEKALAEHNFEETTEQENINFAFHYCRWLTEVFEHGQDGVRASSVKAAAMPHPIKLLLKNNWRDEEFYLGNNAIYLEQNNKFEYTESVIPRWDELIRKHSFQETLDIIASNKEILGGIQLPAVKMHPSAAVVFEHGFSTDGYGLEFLLEPDSIKSVPFGMRGQTQSVSNFTIAHYGNVPLLARTASELALAAVSFSEYTETDPVESARLNQLSLRLAGIEKINTEHAEGSNPPGDRKTLAIEHLLEQGLIQKPLEQVPDSF